MEQVLAFMQSPAVVGAIAGIMWAISAWSKKTDKDGEMTPWSFKRGAVSLVVGALVGVVAQLQGVEIESLTQLTALFGAVVGGENLLKLAIRQGPKILLGTVKPLLAKKKK